MKYIKFLISIFAITCLSGCVQQLLSTHKTVLTNQHSAPQLALQGTETLKRLNTIDCKDYDDWYLDGYRIGKSFQNQKEEMYTHRVDYCREKFPQFKISQRFQQHWNKGYHLAANTKPTTKPTKTLKNKPKRKPKKVST